MKAAYQMSYVNNRTPRILTGEHSAMYVGVLNWIDPMPRPESSLATN